MEIKKCCAIFSAILIIVTALCHLSDEVCSDAHYIRPRCINYPDGYGCKCGPGFYWNQHTCMSAAVDSRLEFQARQPIRYSLLLGKGFPRLYRFTVVLWIKIYNTTFSGTVFSYRKNTLAMMIDTAIRLKVPGQGYRTSVRLGVGRWYHLAWTWSSTNGAWRLYVDGSVSDEGMYMGSNQPVTEGGEFVVGQASRTKVEFDWRNAFLGDISHLHIWTEERNSSDIQAMSTDCTFMYCGNALQWTDIRSGTRGAMRLRWPSGIYHTECFTKESSAFTCNKYCSDLNGAQCNKDVVGNIVWPRTRADHNISADCPGRDVVRDNNRTYGAVRRCVRTADNDGEWLAPYIDGCISPSLLDLKDDITERLTDPTFTPHTLLHLCDNLLSHVSQNTYRNPVDIATVISLLGKLVDKQNDTLTAVTEQHGRSGGLPNYRYPKLNDTETFAQLIASTVDTILADKNNIAWNATNPYGSETDSLMVVMEHFSAVVAKSLEYHVSKGHVFHRPAHIAVNMRRLSFVITCQWVEEFHGIQFPRNSGQTSERDTNIPNMVVSLPQNVLQSYNTSRLPVFVGVSTFYFPESAKLMPNKLKTSKNPKEDNVNTPIVSLFLHMQNGKVSSSNLTQPVVLYMPYLDTKNISNPECVRLVHRNRSEQWYWSRSGCIMQRDDKTTTRSVLCLCYTPGVFAVTSDMYDVNWDKREKRPTLMNATTYVGGSISVLSCLVTCLLLIYLRTASSTAHLHKNLSVAIACSQLCFMIGIDRVESSVACQTFAILIHYFVLATFSWIMNEAFNLYIVITYSAHSQSHSDMADNSSRVRYYVLGWVTPIVLVGAFVGSAGQGYYAAEMCLIDGKHIWFFIGPILAIIVIIILVLIFTAKEHNENSYTKTEKTNKVILTHMKALWTQVIILTCSWAFAFVTVNMTDPLLKYIYAIINCLQGSFFFVFYFLLHDEVRSVFKSHRKKKTLVMQGYDFVGDDASIDSRDSYSLALYGKDTEVGASRDQPSRKNVRVLGTKKRSEIEDSSEEGSDIDMTITSV